MFLATRRELDWFYQGGAGQFWPDLWNAFEDLVPMDERHDMIAAYHKRLFSGEDATERRYARAWAAWENALASIDNDGAGGTGPSDYARAFARLENHYFTHGCFLDEDQQILDNMDRIATIPGVIVQGRLDMICPPVSAWHLSRRWPAARLELIAKAGHALSERGITAELVRTMDLIAAQKSGR